MKHEIRFVLNGEDKTLIVPSNMTLLQLLRDRLEVASPKRSCEQGECGACTVILDGKAVNACLVLAASVDGKVVTTVDGLGETQLHPFAEAFHGPFGEPMRLLHSRHAHGGQSPARRESRSYVRGGQGRALRATCAGAPATSSRWKQCLRRRRNCANSP